MQKIRSDKTIDASTLAPPLPVLHAQRALKELRSGQVLRVIGQSGQTASDFHDFSKLTGNPVHTEKDEEGHLFFLVQKR